MMETKPKNPITPEDLKVEIKLPTEEMAQLLSDLTRIYKPKQRLAILRRAFGIAGKEIWEKKP